MRWFAIFVIASSLLFITKVSADSGIISPLADSYVAPTSQPVTVVSLPNVLGAQSSLSDAVTKFLTVTPTPTPTPLRPEDSAGQAPTPTPTAATRTSRKPQITISLVGDSMIDTLGPDGGGLGAKLNKTYPSTKFTVINHGTGGQNIDTGLLHLTNGYMYLGAERPSIVSQSPDVLVVESFGYNPYSFDTGALQKHWLQLASIKDTVKQQLPNTKLVIAATIAPNWDTFGDGAPFINMSPEGKRQKVATIDSYIESTIDFAKGEHLPLADAYHPSRDANGNGKLQYINGGDHIHYSDAGRGLFAQTVANTIVAQRLLE